MVRLFQETGAAHDGTALRVGRIKQLRDALVDELLSRPAAQVGGEGSASAVGTNVVGAQQNNNNINDTQLHKSTKQQ